MASITNLPQVSWVREYLSEHYPNQPLAERADSTKAMIIDVKDSQGRPKELRISQDFLQRFSKVQIQEYLQSTNIAQQLEDVPSSVSIIDPT